LRHRFSISLFAPSGTQLAPKKLLLLTRLLLDSSFAIIAILPLWLALRGIKRLMSAEDDV